MTVHIWDGNNTARIVFETDTLGLATRRLFNDAYYTDQPTIYVFDGKNAKQSRRLIYPEYKAQRVPAPDNFYVVMGFFKELLMHTAAVQIECAGFEADDVIAHLVRGSPQTEFIIHSTDADYCALENSNVKVQGATMGDIPIEDIRLFKTICYDKSDNVKGIPNFADKGWLKLTREHKKQITDWIGFGGMLPSCLGEVLSPKSFAWAISAAGFQTLQAYWQVVDFMPVSAEVVAAGMKVGKRDLALADSKLKEILQ